MSNIISKYYSLSEMLNDDTYLTVHVIRAYSKQDISFKAVLRAVESLKLEEYEDCIDDALDAGEEAVIASSIGLTFRNERDYMNYLIKLLDSNSIGYAPFHLVGSCNDSFQGSLF